MLPIETTVFSPPPGRLLSIGHNLIVLVQDSTPSLAFYKNNIFQRSLPLLCPLVQSQPVAASILTPLVAILYSCGSIVVFEFTSFISVKRVIQSTPITTTPTTTFTTTPTTTFTTTPTTTFTTTENRSKMEVKFITHDKIISSTGREISVHELGLLVTRKTRILELPSDRLGSFRAFRVPAGPAGTVVGLIFEKAMMVVELETVKVVWKGSGGDMVLRKGERGPWKVGKAPMWWIGREVVIEEDQGEVRVMDKEKEVMRMKGKMMGMIGERSLVIDKGEKWGLVTIQSWSELVKALIHQHRWEEGLEICAGLGKGRLPWLLDEKLGEGVMKAGLIAFATGGVREREVSDVIDVCLRVSEGNEEISEFVCSEITKFFDTEKFLERTEKFVISKSFQTNTETTKRLLLWLEGQQDFPNRAEQVLLSAVAQGVVLDCDFAIRFCAKHNLTIPLVVVHTNLLHDFVTPIRLLLPDDGQLLEYLRQSLRCLNFPFNTPLPPNTLADELTTFVFSAAFPAQMSKRRVLEVLPETAAFASLVRKFWPSEDTCVYLARVALATEGEVERPKETLRALMKAPPSEVGALCEYILSSTTLSRAEDVIDMIFDVVHVDCKKFLNAFVRKHVHLLGDLEKFANFQVSLGLAEGRGDFETCVALFESSDEWTIDEMSAFLSRNSVDAEYFDRLVAIALKKDLSGEAARSLAGRNFRFPGVSDFRSSENLQVIENHAITRNQIFRELGNLTKSEISVDSGNFVRKKKTANLVEAADKCVICRLHLKGVVAVSDGRLLHEACWSTSR